MPLRMFNYVNKVAGKFRDGSCPLIQVRGTKTGDISEGKPHREVPGRNVNPSQKVHRHTQLQITIHVERQLHTKEVSIRQEAYPA